MSALRICIGTAGRRLRHLCVLLAAQSTPGVAGAKRRAKPAREGLREKPAVSRMQGNLPQAVERRAVGDERVRRDARVETRIGTRAGTEARTARARVEANQTFTLLLNTEQRGPFVRSSEISAAPEELRAFCSQRLAGFAEVRNATS